MQNLVPLRSFYKILVSVDGLGKSKGVIEEVISICQGLERNCRVTLFHIIPDRRSLDTQIEQNDSRENRVARMRLIIKQATSKLKKAGIRYRVEIGVGDQDDELQKRTHRENYDLVVVERKIDPSVPCTVLIK